MVEQLAWMEMELYLRDKTVTAVLNTAFFIMVLST